MLPIFFSSANRDAPVLSNTIGDLVTLLNKTLVSGYPTQSITSINRSGSVATVALTSHGYVTGDIVTISGANEDEYNGNFVVTVSDADEFTYTVPGTPATPATGTLVSAGAKDLVTAGSVTRSANLVTVTATSHGFAVGQEAVIAGANETDYNGRWIVTTVPDSDTFTYDIGSLTPATPATGTIKVRHGYNGLGWQLAFTGTNKSAYRAREGSSRCYLRVAHDTNAYNARVRGFETMSDIDNGTGLFPTDAQVSGGMWWQTTNNTAGNRLWKVWGDDKTFYFRSKVGTANDFNAGHFGEFQSYKIGDAFNCLLIGKLTSLTSAAEGEFFLQLTTTPGGFAAALTGHYVPRSYTQVATSIGVNKTGDCSRRGLSSPAYLGTGTAGSNIMGFPHSIDGSLHVGRIFIGETGIGVRGALRGLWDLLHNYATGETGAYPDGTVIEGADDLVNKKFQIVSLRYVNLGGLGGAVMDYGDWD